MTNRLILAADFGTSGVKAFVFTDAFESLADSYAEYPTQRPGPGFAEQRPDDLWNALRTVFQDVLKRAIVEPGDIAVIGMSSHYPSMLALDEGGKPVVPAQTWMDERGDAYCSEVERVIAEQPDSTNDNPVEGFYPLPKVLWLKEHQPELFGRTAIVSQLYGYLAARLTGERVVVDRTSASWFHNFDLWKDAWSLSVNAALDLPDAIFPPLKESFEIAGEVTGDAAAETGLAPGTPVIVGTGDAVAAALGAGVAEPGDAYMTTGTGGCVCVVTSDPQFRPGLVTEAFPSPGRWLIEGILKNVGVLLQWYLRELGYPEQLAGNATKLRPYAVMDAEAAASPPGSRGLICLPYFSGEQSPVTDANSRGIFFGLSLETTRGDLIRSLLEGVAYAVAHNLEVIAKTGAEIEELRVTGGPVGSDVWAQILADVTGTTIARPKINETAPLGVAILAAKGAGLIGSFEEARQAIELDRRFEPQRSNRAVYRDRFGTYKELYERTRTLFAGAQAGG